MKGRWREVNGSGGEVQGRCKVGGGEVKGGEREVEVGEGR